MKSELYKDRNKDGKRVSKIIVASVDLDPCEKVGGGVKTCWCSSTPRRKIGEFKGGNFE